MQTVTHSMSMTDPPISLQNHENVPRLTYIQDIIHPLQNSETKFPPVNDHCVKMVLFSLYLEIL